MCCGGKVSKKTHLNMDCCGKKAFHVNDQVCCNGKLHKRSSKKFSDRYYGYHACCGNVTIAYGQGCCNGKTYLKKYNICCNGNIVNTPNYRHECCGITTYHYMYNRCCNGVPTRRGSFDKHSCCGTTIYNKGTQKCVNGKVEDKESFEGTSAMRGAVIQGEALCNGKTYDSATQMRCGGKKIYSRTTKEGQYNYCCGKGQYSSCTEICYGGVVYSKKEYTSCCYTKPTKCGTKKQTKPGTPYNYQRHFCEAGKLFEGNKYKTEFCVDEKIDKSSQLCCDGKIINYAGVKIGYCSNGVGYDRRKIRAVRVKL